MDKLLLEKFSKLLGESLNLLNDLNEMADEEKRALIDCSYDNLDIILKRREQKLDMFQCTITELERIFPKLAKMNKGEVTTLKDLSKYIDEPYSTLFRNFPGEFHGLIKVIHESNIRNLVVLNHCKETIYEFLCNLAQDVQPLKTYSSHGMMQKKVPPSFITSNL